MSADQPLRIWFERRLPEACADLLGGQVQVAGCGSDTPESPAASLCDAHGIIASVRIRYNDEAFARMPSLRVVARTGIGVDNIDLPAATRRAIAVCNAPDAPSLSTAEHAFALLLALAKQLKASDRALECGERRDFFSASQAVELHGTELGLIGFGRIARLVAHMARGMSMRVRTFDPFVDPGVAARAAVGVADSLESLLRSADFVSIHVPLTPATRHLINTQSLGWMKRGAVLVNCARGGLIDETAVAAALDRGDLLGAGLDVFETEPPPASHPLLGRADVIATPHVASATGSGKRRLWEAAVTQAVQVLRGERPANLVNPEVWPLVAARVGMT